MSLWVTAEATFKQPGQVLRHQGVANRCHCIISRQACPDDESQIESIGRVWFPSQGHKEASLKFMFIFPPNHF